MLFALGAVIVGAFATDHIWIRGTGIIAGELTAVSPIVQARLEQLFVQCLDRVTRGQRLAEFLNEATAQAAAQQLQQRDEALAATSSEHRLRLGIS
jgi:multidrug efflux pump subunit AcrA (membrane-fusion protein)